MFERNIKISTINISVYLSVFYAHSSLPFGFPLLPRCLPTSVSLSILFLSSPCASLSLSLPPTACKISTYSIYLFSWDNNCEALEEYIPTWLDMGVKIVGGCCRVCANYIGKIIDEVRKWENEHV